MLSMVLISKKEKDSVTSGYDQRFAADWLKYKFHLCVTSHGINFKPQKLSIRKIGKNNDLMHGGVNFSTPRQV